MKKMFFLLLLAAGSLAGLASGPEDTWVQSADGKVVCKKIVILAESLRVVLENGEKKNIPIETITSYSQKGKLFNKLPLYGNGAPVMVFMELLKTRDELSLYRYIGPNGTNSFIVYNGDKPHQYVDDTNRQGIFKYFEL